MLILSAALCTVLAVVFIGFVILFLRRTQSQNIFRRLRRHNISEATSRAREKDPLGQRLYLFVKRTAKPFLAWQASRSLDIRLRQAGIPLYGAEFIIISLIISVTTGIIIYVMTMNIRLAPASALMVIMFMWFWLSMRIRHRKNSFTEQLGDCLTTVANALRAGYSFQQAMDVVSKEMEPPISSEFERVMTDVAMGVSLENALEQMNRRVGSADFDLVVTAVLIQREVGGNLAQILDTISDTINERVRMKREINALTAQGRLSSWVLICLPIAMAVFCWTFNHDQMMVFVEEEAGRYALIFAIIMEIIGYLVIQRIVDIEI